MRYLLLIALLYTSSIIAQPANDDCSNAINLGSPTSVCTLVAGTNEGVVSTDYDPCPEFSKRNVWYKFTATSTTHVVQLTLNAMTNGIIDVYSGTCGSLSFVGSSCNFGQAGSVISRTLSGLTIGNEYLIAISTREQSEEGTFSVCVYTPPAPANDDCNGAITLGVNPSNIPVSRTPGTTEFATQSLAGCSGTADDDVWYSFTATETSHRIFLQTLTLQNAVAEVLSGTCGSLVSVQCISSGFNGQAKSSNLITGLTVGQTYFIRIYSSALSATAIGTFSIAITSSPANNECSGAFSVTPSANGSNACVSSVAGSTFDATQSDVDCFGGTSTSNDTWFSFTATQAVHSVKVYGFGSNSIRFQMMQGSCGSLTSLFCSVPAFSEDTATAKVGNLTVGQTYFVRVYSGNSGGVQGLFNVCVASPVFPLNDGCNDATVLTASSDSTTNFISGTTIGATNVSVSGSCNSVGLDVWYKFTASSAQHVIKALNLTNNASLTIELFSGNCNTLIHQRCGNAGDSLFGLGNLVVGQTYFIRIYNGSLITGDDFKLAVFTPQSPANDECSTAQVIVPTTDASCDEISGSNLGATQSTIENCDGNAFIGNIRDVWFRFTASSTSHRIRLIKGTGDRMRFQLYSGSCNSRVSIACSVQNTSTIIGTGIEQRFDGLTIGADYFIRVFTTGFDAAGTFDLCVKSVVVPANNECSSPVTLIPQANVTFGNFITGNTTDATQSAQATQCSAGQDDDVWYSFIASQATMKLLLQNGTVGATRIAVYSGSCGALVLVKCQTGNVRDNVVVLTGLNTGTTYLVRVYSTATSGSQGTFSLMVTTEVNIPANDDCVNAVELIPSANNNCHGTVGSTIDASASSNASCVSGNEVWFKFTALFASHRVNLKGFVNAPVVAVFTGSCAGLTQLPSACTIGSMQASVTVNSLSVGTTYFIKVLTNTTASFQQSIFSICVTTPQVPANDLCNNAIALTVDEDATVEPTQLYSTNLATFTGAPNCFAAGNDIWFSFVAPAVPVIIEVNALNVNPGIELLQGSCASLTSMRCNGTSNFDLNNVINSNNLVAGNTYLLRVSASSFSGPLEFAIKVYKTASQKLNTSIDTACLTTNLILNPGFETDFSFPSSFIGSANPGTEFIPGWKLPTRGTADFFNAMNATGSAVDVPFNLCFGQQSARNGFGYGGFFAYTSSAGSYREYFETRLSSPLVPGKRYLVSMYVSLADFSSIAVDNIGAALRTSSTSILNFTNLNFTPQLVSPDGAFITDKKGWVNISAVIIADQPYTHLVIGNFKNNSATDTLRLVDTSGLLSGGSFAGCASTAQTAYYFVDDVLVSEISGAGCGVLPLHWLSFNGKRRGDVVDLQWKTANEINTSHFIVERSKNGFDFSPMGNVQAANRSGEHQYGFADAQPLKGINYYRLKQMDRSGVAVYSNIINAVFGDAVFDHLKLYPQPVHSILNIQYNGDEQNISLQVFDATGRIVMNERRRNNGIITINTEKLTKGSYWIIVSDGVSHQKGQFIKQ